MVIKIPNLSLAPRVYLFVSFLSAHACCAPHGRHLLPVRAHRPAPAAAVSVARRPSAAAEHATHGQRGGYGDAKVHNMGLSQSVDMNQHHYNGLIENVLLEIGPVQGESRQSGIYRLLRPNSAGCSEQSALFWGDPLIPSSLLQMLS